MIQAEGQEVLVIDRDQRVQKGVEHLLRTAGLTPTVLSDPRRAEELVVEKHFAVAVVDLDTPQPDEGVLVIERLRRLAPRTVVLAISGRRVFDAAVAAFRAGAADVIVKAPDQVDYLRTRIVRAATEQQKRCAEQNLLEETAALHDELMKVLLDTYKRSIDLEQGKTDDDGEGILDEVTTMLLVEDDGWLGGQLQAVLDDRYELETVATGGEALDAAAGARRFQIALVKDSLPDLPGSMVVRTVKAQSPETIVLLYSRPQGPRPGSIQVIDTARTIPFLPSFTRPGQLAERLDELRAAFRATAQERRYLGAFRQQHFELLKRFAELKQKLQRARTSD